MIEDEIKMERGGGGDEGKNLFIYFFFSLHIILRVLDGRC
jgi:hypothetical protein